LKILAIVSTQALAVDLTLRRNISAVLIPDWSVKPTLSGELCQLRPFEESDFPALGRALSDPEMLRLTGSVHRTEDASKGNFELDDVGLAWYRSRNAASDRLDLAIVDMISGECVGESVLNDYSEGNQSCNFRIWIGPGGRNKGIGTEATKLTVDYGLRVLRLHRIELSVYEFNPRAKRVYEKAGFTTEGISRNALQFDGEWIDAINMSVLATD
jgi:RimJ/RimL family protein N-acetyltransferase